VVFVQFDPLATHWKEVHESPSLHDVEEWDFGNETVVGLYTEELLDEYEARDVEKEFVPKGLCAKMVG
jgi:hypothetical protein